MALKRDWLTRDERDELRQSLLHRRALLTNVDRVGNEESARRDARWRLHVVEILLADLGDR